MTRANKLLILAVGILFVMIANLDAAPTNNKGEGYALDYASKVVLKSKVLRVSAANGLTSSEQTLDFSLPAGAVVSEVYVNVITAEVTGGTKTLDVGTLSTASGDADGLLDGISVASTGLKKGTLLSSGQTLGALLRVDESGSSGFVPEPYINTAAKPISVTAGSPFSQCVADIIIVYKEIKN